MLYAVWKIPWVNCTEYGSEESTREHVTQLESREICERIRTKKKLELSWLVTWNDLEDN